VISRGVPQIQYPAYRDYIASRVEVNTAMAALLAGSRLAAHTLSLTTGSTATLGELFPAVEHIGRFNLRSDEARDLLHNADYHIASVSVPYALATHEDFVMSTLDYLEREGRTLIRHGKPVRAWNMHAVLFETCGKVEPADWMEMFHVMREMRNCITHEGGMVSQKLRDAIANMGAAARTEWVRMNLGSPPQDIDQSGSLALTAEHMFTAFAVTKRLGREINALMRDELSGTEWARIIVADHAAATTRTKNSNTWRRALAGYKRMHYADAPVTDSDLEAAARHLGFWTLTKWS
jgi:hypothetical protein